MSPFWPSSFNNPTLLSEKSLSHSPLYSFLQASLFLFLSPNVLITLFWGTEFKSECLYLCVYLFMRLWYSYISVLYCGWKSAHLYRAISEYRRGFDWICSRTVSWYHCWKEWQKISPNRWSWTPHSFEACHSSPVVLKTQEDTLQVVYVWFHCILFHI